MGQKREKAGRKGTMLGYSALRIRLRTRIRHYRHLPIVLFSTFDIQSSTALTPNKVSFVRVLQDDVGELVIASHHPHQMPTVAQNNLQHDAYQQRKRRSQA